jgi:hypothetical protein
MIRLVVVLLVLALNSFAAEYKGISVGQSVDTLPKELRCFSIYCVGQYKGDWLKVIPLHGHVFMLDVIYVGKPPQSPFQRKVSVSRSISLAKALRLHSLQSGMAAPVLGEAQGESHVTYGIVDTANGISYHVTGTPTAATSSVTNVVYLSGTAPVLKAPALSADEAAELIAAAQRESLTEIQSISIAVTASEPDKNPAPKMQPKGLTVSHWMRHTAVTYLDLTQKIMENCGSSGYYEKVEYYEKLLKNMDDHIQIEISSKADLAVWQMLQSNRRFLKAAMFCGPSVEKMTVQLEKGENVEREAFLAKVRAETLGHQWAGCNTQIEWTVKHGGFDEKDSVDECDSAHAAAIAKQKVQKAADFYDNSSPLEATQSND